MTFSAHNLFDYPGINVPDGADGWQFRAIDAANTFHAMQPVDGISQTATPLAFLGCSDQHCIVGRDFLHPGYDCRPCLQWTAPAAGRFRMRATFAIVRQWALDELAVSVYFDDVRLMTAHIRYPEVARIDVPFAAKAGSVLRVIVHAVGRIDNLLTYYAASVEEGQAGISYFVSPIATPRAETAFYTIAQDEAWRVLAETFVAGTNDADAVVANAFAKGSFIRPQASKAGAAAVDAYYGHLHRHQLEAFRRPRFFAAPEKAAE